VRKRASIRVLVVVAIGLAFCGALARAEPAPIAKLSELLSFPGYVHIETLSGLEKVDMVERLRNQEGTQALVAEMRRKGFDFDSIFDKSPERVKAERVIIEGEDSAILEMITVPCMSNGLSGALTAIVDDKGESLIQAHHTNLDPKLSGVPDPAIEVNAMPYFYITTLRWIGGRIVPWYYWWYDSHHHPNWYYSHYYWYWCRCNWYGHYWPYWYWWYHGWYYWQYWYYWSSWFPW